MVYALYRQNDTWLAYYNPKESLWTPINGAIVNVMVGTTLGRIFMNSKGRICELTYQEEGWFKGSTSIKTLTGTNVFFGSWADRGSNQNITSLVFDGSRNMLYSLSLDNAIRAYYLGKDGSAWKIKGEFHIYKNIESRIQQGQPPSSVDPGNFASIYPILKTESPSTCLVAVSDFGHRWYFTSFNALGYQSPNPPYPVYQTNTGFSPFVDLENKEPETFRLLFILYPPPAPSVTVESSKYEIARYHHSFFFTQRGDMEKAKLLLTSPNYGAIFAEVTKTQGTNVYHKQAKYHEFFSVVEVNSRILHDITEIYNPQRDPLFEKDYSNELINQYSAPRRRFIFAAEEALTIVSRLRPVDHLKQILEKYRSDMPDPKRFLQNYGELETSAMCFDIATRESHDFLLSFRGEPRAMPMGNLLNITRSPVYEGFATCLARTLRPIWKKTILKPSPNRTNPNRRDINFPPDLLHEIVRRLIRLKKFYEDYPALSYVPDIPNEAWKNENLWLIDLYELTRSCADALSFILLMIDYNLPDAIASIPERSQPALWNSTFSMLMTDEQTKKNWKELVLAIIRRENRPQVDNLSHSLEQRCHSFCKAADVKIYQAYEELQQAKNSQESHARMKYFERSLKLFLENIENMTYDTLENICHEYQALHYNDGALELALNGSQAPGITNRAPYQDLAIESMKTAEVFGKGPPIKVSSEFSSQVLHKALNIGAKMRDKDFLFRVYDEFFRGGSIRNLFEVAAPYLEEYFKEGGPTEKIGKLEIYCEYHIRHNQHFNAASIQHQLAESPEFDLNLEMRLKHLSLAVSFMKAGIGGYNAPSGAMESLKEYEDLLQIGQVQYEIYNRLRLQLQGQPNSQQILNALNNRLLTKQALWDQFINPFELYDCTLDLLTVNEPPDIDLVSSIWQSIIRKAPNYEELREEVIRLGRKYYPGELLVFPPWLICRLLIIYCVQNPPKPQQGWIVNIFHQLNIPYRTIFDILVDLHSERPPPLNQAQGLRFILEEILQLIIQWKQDTSADDFDSQHICELISNYTDSSPAIGADQVLIQRFLQLRAELQR
ncbi:hypothetical protein G9A89_010368 [Geosiphon pyriformis]|nr:hypothetical protein G9A89_010368 [Geosiphon pyriformis]